MSFVVLRRLGFAGAVASALILLTLGPVQAHVVTTVGPYTIALGWAHEPTYVGEFNAVQVFVTDADGKPVADIGDGDLSVVVSVGGQQSSPLALSPTYDEDTGLGTPGDYEAPIIPTAPGDYTFHLTGKIHAQAVDETATSSDSTFDPVVESTGIQFPNTLPSLTELTASIDRINARLSASPSPAATSAPAASLSPVVTDAISAAQDAATQAKDSASTALLVGILVGGLGVILGGIALILVVRRPRTA